MCVGGEWICGLADEIQYSYSILLLAAEPPPKVSTTAKLPLQFAPEQFD